MAFDIFKGINLTPGQEVRAQDLKDLQNFFLSRVLDGMLERLVPGPPVGDLEAGTNLLFNAVHGSDVPSSEYAYALSCGGAYPRKGTANTKIQIAPGTLFQKVAASDGDEPTFLPYTFAGTEEVTISAGHATNPRIDLVQMKLELVDDDSQARVFAQAGVQSNLDIAPLTSNCETVVRARNGGFGGDAISLRFVADGTGTGSLTRDGYALTFHYETAVTTVANFETAVAASDLIEIETTDGTGTLTSPGDTFSATYFSGGSDQVLTSQNLMMKRRVQMTLSVVTGTAGASPAFPTCTAGYVAIASVYVPATWTGVGVPVSTDHAISADSIVLHDQRMPLGTPRIYHVWPKDMIGDPTYWVLNTGIQSGRTIANASSVDDLLIPLMAGAGGGEGSGRGRILAVEVATSGGTTPYVYLTRYVKNSSGGAFTMNSIADLGSLANTGANLVADRLGTPGVETNAIVHIAGPVTVTPNSLMGVPTWANGRRGLSPPDTAEDNFDQESLMLRVGKASGTMTVHRATFIVAEGL